MNTGMSFDPSSIIAKLDRLNSEVQGNIIRTVTQSVTQVIYDEVKARTPVSNSGHWFYGTSYKINGTKYWFDAGTLNNSIYQAYSKDNSGNGIAEYHVAWNHKKCPYGHMVEYGTSKTPQHSFLRSGYEAAKNAAMQAADSKVAEMMEQINAR